MKPILAFDSLSQNRALSSKLILCLMFVSRKIVLSLRVVAKTSLSPMLFEPIEHSWLLCNLSLALFGKDCTNQTNVELRESL